MPAGDGTGPAGRGPLTGRGAGYCAGMGILGYATQVPGRGLGMGWGRGWGRGRGWRHQYFATGLPAWARYDWGAPFEPVYPAFPAQPTEEQEAQLLRAQAKWLQGQLEAIARQVEALEAQER